MPAIRPTRVRWKMAALLFVIMAVTNLGRLNVSVAGKYIQDEFLLSTRTMGWILSAFAFGYAAFQIPCGWAGDHFGPRKTLAAAMGWWSGLTAFMAVVPRVLHNAGWFSVAWGFAVIRFLTGAGEAASYPTANKMVAFWMSPRERGIGSSFLLAGVGAGGILAPMLVAWLVQISGWRTSFYVWRLRNSACSRMDPIFQRSSARSSGSEFCGTGAHKRWNRDWQKHRSYTARNSLAHAFGELVDKGAVGQLFFSWLYAIHLLRLVFHLFSTRPWVQRQPGKFLGRHSLHRHHYHGAFGRLGVRCRSKSIRST